ncbi:MAG: iron-containing alcohol dehydrogenase family protein [Halobacteriales archaeon]
MASRSHRFSYHPPVLRVGRGAVEDLGSELDRLGVHRTVAICGRTVGANPATIDPLVDALGDRLVDVFDETTPAKRLATAVAAAERAAALEADALVGLGGGSSLDVARVASAISTLDDTDAAYDRFVADGTFPLGDDPAPPVVAVPTTLAGADLSDGAGVSAHPSTDPVDSPVFGGVRDPRLMPRVVVFDPALVATAPRGVLVGSVMNGFDKGLEALYAPTRGPVTDATATRGLRLLASSLPDIDGTIDDVVEGILLVQYGASRPDASTLSLIHAFGHGLTATADVQQGVAHAVMAPPTLAYLFEHVDGRRDLLASALGVDASGLDDAGTARAVVQSVASIRDGLGLPSALRDIGGLERADLPAVARRTSADRLARNVPDGLETDSEALRLVLESAW